MGAAVHGRRPVINRRALVLAFGLLAATIANDSIAARSAEPPRISKPRPAPPTPPDIPPLPPAYYDPTLAVGGEDVKARKVETPAERRRPGQRPRPLQLHRRQRRRYLGGRPAHRARPAAAARHAGDPQRHDRAQHRRSGQGRRADRSGRAPSATSSFRRCANSTSAATGMIGIDALVRQRLMMDFEKRLIKVEDARIPEVFLPGEIVITARRQRGQLILTQVTRRRPAARRGHRHRVRDHHRQPRAARQADPRQQPQVLDGPGDRGHRRDRGHPAGDDR